MSHEADCIFCKIVAGEISCHKLYEDDQVLSFLDVGPLSHGHTLVIPKVHYPTLDRMPVALAGACMQTVSRVGQAVTRATGMPGWNVLQNNGAVAGQVVMHVHFHVIPRTAEDGLGFRWPAGQLDQSKAESLVREITDAMKP